jgi:hypothetical protein
MKKYPFRVIPKASGSEVNIARLLQPIDFSSSKVEIEEAKTITEEKKVEGPIKSSVQVSSRKITKDEKITEFTLKASKSDKVKTWLGKSDESGKYAILVHDGNEVKIVLADHWYKFSPIFQGVNLGTEKSVDIGPVKRQKEEDERNKEIFGEDSEEDKPKKKRPVRTRNDDDESAKEGIDFDDEFTDDEEVLDDDDKEKSEEAAIKHNLSLSGKEIQKFLMTDKGASGDESGSSSDIGLSEEESDKEGINKQAVINELTRLGRCKLGELISECKKKFKNENDMMHTLSNIIKEVAVISGTGQNADVMLKEEYKRSMPSFGVRIHWLGD